MDASKIKHLLCKLAAGYAVLVVLIYLVGYRAFHIKVVKPEQVASAGNTVELKDGMDFSQEIVSPAETITGVIIRFGTVGRSNAGVLHITLRDLQKTELAAEEINVSQLNDRKETEIKFDQPFRHDKEDTITLHIQSEGCANGNAVTIQTGISGDRTSAYYINGMEQNGVLCAELTGEISSNAWLWYWIICAGIFALGVLGTTLSWKDALNGKENLLYIISTLFIQYRFLLKQLVIRDFKTKYKRSMLGVGWSFLNPLLTMSVQYVVFSTLFRSDIPNYPVYLLIGIVFMNYFSEAVTLGLTSITSNSSLIKKVKVPKYIFSLSRVVSSLINFGYALIPLGLAILITGNGIHLSYLLIIFDVMCLFGFILGMVFLFATSMTFFQDTQFLWSVISLLWMYLTPVFYPETIIPTVIRPIYRLNPMYQYITFARTCIIYGNAPEPEAYLGCALSSVLVLAIGITVFRKNQDKFILYL